MLFTYFFLMISSWINIEHVYYFRPKYHNLKKIQNKINNQEDSEKWHTKSVDNATPWGPPHSGEFTRWDTAKEITRIRKHIIRRSCKRGTTRRWKQTPKIRYKVYFPRCYCHSPLVAGGRNRNIPNDKANKSWYLSFSRDWLDSDDLFLSWKTACLADCMTKAASTWSPIVGSKR